MRHKSGNGHGAPLQKFLADIKNVVRDGEYLLKTGGTGVKRKAVASAKSTDELVHSHPYKTLGVIFGIGLVAGIIISGMLGEEEIEQEEELY